MPYLSQILTGIFPHEYGTAAQNLILYVYIVNRIKFIFEVYKCHYVYLNLNYDVVTALVMPGEMVH